MLPRRFLLLCDLVTEDREEIRYSEAINKTTWEVLIWDFSSFCGSMISTKG